MKVLHIATIDIGGAYQAANRLHQALQNEGIESNILLRTKVKEEHAGEEVFSNSLERILSKAKNVWNLIKKDGEISRDVLGTDVSKHPYVQSADVIVLHWINSFLTPKEIKKLSELGKPILWFMHDMWLFTGGCHVDGYCGRYEEGCGNCPQVKKPSEQDISYQNVRTKQELLRNMEVTIAGPSRWIVACANKSVVTANKKVIYLPNMIDCKKFHPIDQKQKAMLRKKYGMISSKKVILFGAADAGTENQNKGFYYLKEAIKTLDPNDFQLVVFGNSATDLDLPEAFEVTLLGFIQTEEQMAEVYHLADVFVNPSNQESFGFTTCEAMACGTPTVAFPIGGLKDQIIHQKNGYLAEYHNIEDMAEGIRFCCQHEELGIEARNGAKRFASENVIKQYIEVLNTL